MDTKAIGQHIRERQKYLDVTWESIARRTGMTAKHVSNYANSRVTHPSVDKLEALSIALREPADTLWRVGNGEKVPADGPLRDDMSEEVAALRHTVDMLDSDYRETRTELADIRRILDAVLDRLGAPGDDPQSGEAQPPRT